MDTNNPDAISVFFNRFGSHFLTGIVMGGRATLASSTDKLSVKRDYSVSMVAQASYEGLTGQLSAENRTKYGESISSFSQYSTSHQEVLGGNGGLASGVFTGKEGYQKWVDSVGSSPDLWISSLQCPWKKFGGCVRMSSKPMQWHHTTIMFGHQNNPLNIK
ncbi:MAC/perforin domain-containing protein [Pectobacterium odoriferum]|uniref:MAC/perforin domain-containing protein n=1 Tax=Pectobacterium odoriferum TaxID=78398 RepID=UPI0009B82805|nr:MAC/perforin domain-containing protein [Pectobacterium odoriferum]